MKLATFDFDFLLIEARRHEHAGCANRIILSMMIEMYVSLSRSCWGPSAYILSLSELHRSSCRVGKVWLSQQSWARDLFSRAAEFGRGGLLGSNGC
jgi:hypothetical protein